MWDTEVIGIKPLALPDLTAMSRSGQNYNDPIQRL